MEPGWSNRPRSPASPDSFAMARKIEEDEFRQGAGRLTEVWDTQLAIPLLTSHTTEPPRRQKRGLEEELEEIVTGVPGTTKWKDGEMAPKRFRSAHQPLQ